MPKPTKTFENSKSPKTYQSPRALQDFQDLQESPESGHLVSTETHRVAEILAPFWPESPAKAGGTAGISPGAAALAENASDLSDTTALAGNTSALSDGDLLLEEALSDQSLDADPWDQTAPHREPQTLVRPWVVDSPVAIPADQLLDGLVTEGSRGMYRVETAQGVLLCSLRGKLRKKLVYAVSPNLRHKVRRANVASRDPIAVGDRVRVVSMGGDRGMIEEVLPRTGAFVREDAGVASHASKGNVTTVAGIDQLVAVFAARDPEPHLRLLDRVLVLAEAQELNTVICLNKVDLDPPPVLLERLEVYRALGYPVVLVSAATGGGLAELRQHLGGHTSALVGPSGVGKSSLLNAIEPGLGQKVSAISGTTHKGRHTTSGTRVVPLEGEPGGYVADTAGIRTMALGSIAAGRLDWCFRELRPYLGQCHHDDCGHRHEPGCVVQQAVKSGTLDRERYDSYCRLYDDGAASGGRAWRDLVSSRQVVGQGEFRL